MSPVGGISLYSGLQRSSVLQWTAEGQQMLWLSAECFHVFIHDDDHS